MLQDTDHDRSPLAAPGIARKLSTRAALGFALVAAILISLLGSSSTLVGAVSTDSSRVAGNDFAAAVRVDAGVVDLSATPTTGESFGPGADTGTVSFDMQPHDAAPLDLRAGDTITAVIALPPGSRPTEIPAADTGTGFSREWSAVEFDGRWEVRLAATATADGTIELPNASFPVDTEFVAVTEDSARTATGYAEFSERLAGTLPAVSAVFPTAWSVQSGVYALGGSTASTTAATIRFQSQPDAGGETLHLRAGDELSTVVTLPAGVTPGALPARSSVGGITTEWTSARAGNGWLVTQTRTATTAVPVVPNSVATFPVVLAAGLSSSGFSVRADATLPARLVSAQPSAEARVNGQIAKPALGRVSAGGGQSLALTKPDYLPYGWGNSRNGQVGTGSTTFVSTPTWLGFFGNQKAIQMSAGARHTIALSSDLRLYGWGDDSLAQVGAPEQPATVTKPVRLTPDVDAVFSQVSAGYEHSLALSTRGKLYGWGYAPSGALGSSAEHTLRFRPTLLETPTGVDFVQVEAGNGTTLALASDGTVWGMGTNTDGSLGLGAGVAKTDTLTRIPMPGNAQIAQLASNSSTTSSHTIAVTTTGELIAWGENAGGQAGTALDGSQPAKFLEPTKIRMPHGVGFTRVAAGHGVSLALGADGRVYSWGNNAQGVANGSPSAVPRPVALPAVSGGYVDIAAGDLHAFAIGANNQLYGWGYGVEGRLGNNSNALQNTPVLIPLALSRAEVAGETDDASLGAEDDSDGSDPTLGTDETSASEESGGSGPAHADGDLEPAAETGDAGDSDSAGTASGAGEPSAAAGVALGDGGEEVGETRSSFDTQLAHRPIDMALHRPYREHELVSDLLVTEPVSREPRDAEFSVAQLGEYVAPSTLIVDPRGD